MKSKSHIESIFNSMINDITYIKLSTYSMSNKRKLMTKGNH